MTLWALLAFVVALLWGGMDWLVVLRLDERLRRERDMSDTDYRAFWGEHEGKEQERNH